MEGGVVTCGCGRGGLFACSLERRRGDFLGAALLRQLDLVAMAVARNAGRADLLAASLAGNGWRIGPIRWQRRRSSSNHDGDRVSMWRRTLYDDDGSLVGLICLSLDVRTLQEVFSPSATAQSFESSAKPDFHVHNRPKSGSQNKGYFDSQQPLQSTITSKITTFATKVTSRARSRVRTGYNCNVQYSSGCEDQDSEHEIRAELTSSEASTTNGDVRHGVFVAEEKSSGKSSKTSDDSREGKVGFHKMFTSKAEGLPAKKGIPWPWKGRENDGGSDVTSTPLHDKQENDGSHQRVLEPITIPKRQDSEYAQTTKYEVSGSWWIFNNNSTSSMSSTSSNGSPIERLDYEADCLDYEILWEDQRD
ncbi:uncharacterized protein LOC124696469 [Lolium rigidum]|uniref:uncharacterized protein LOC124696469 n=1 Tax=Lolium rigidum TaxID=89674 RepID=UPI001F5C2133|nr:uncharacterized protein LOC124696469 [Lolium rigidum]